MTDAPKSSKLSADGITAPLRYPTFRRIWLASLLSNLGILIQGVGAAWAMTQMAASADKVALVQTALMLPIMLISMPAGAIAVDEQDRGYFGRRGLRKRRTPPVPDCEGQGARALQNRPPRQFHERSLMISAF